MKVMTMKCTSCQKQKASLKPQPSRLIKEVRLFLCPACVDKRYEPKFTIIMYVLQNGINDKVKPYISEHKYIGDPILLEEVVTR